MTRIPRNTVQDRGIFHISHLGYSEEYQAETTAIVLDNSLFLILEGDHKDNLSALDLQGCWDYFLDHIDQASPFSEHKYLQDGQNTWNAETNARRILGDQNVERLPR